MVGVNGVRGWGLVGEEKKREKGKVGATGTEQTEEAREGVGGHFAGRR